MFEQLNEVRSNAFNDPDWTKFGSFDPHYPFDENPKRSRYRYVSELYIAALLSFTNKFGTGEDFNAAKARLFAWAFTPRVEHLRVQYRTIDNRGTGVKNIPSAFVVLRNSSMGQAVYELQSSSEQYDEDPDHEPELSAVLKKLGER